MYKTFYVDCGTYEFGINFCVTEDLKKASRYINFKLELPSEKNTRVTEKDFNGILGKVFSIHGYCPIVWIPGFPKTPTEIGTAIHEIFHVVCDCLNWAEIPLAESSEEAYCHLIKYITKKFFIQSQKSGK